MRPTIALCCIAKDEAHNLGPLIQSVKGCFDEIHITDTGSTDGTLDVIEKINERHEELGVPKIQVHHFKWIDDFSAAREYSFSHAKTDYVAWLDLDDSLSSPEAFIKWRDSVMHSAHYWMAQYNYAFNQDGSVACKFIRERVIKRDHGFKWEYFVHEGLIQSEGKKFWPQRATTWWINHRRSEEDKKSDYLRNIKLIEQRNVDELPPRMKFYYGKEMVENGFNDKAGKPLVEAVQSGKLDVHDMLLAIQYAAMSAFQAKAYSQSIDLLFSGIKLEPSRAEYWCLLGDVYISQNDISKAIHAYKMAQTCHPNDYGGIVVIYDYAYCDYPRQRLVDIYLSIGDIARAEEAIDWFVKNKHPKAEEFADQLEKIKDMSTVRLNLPKSDDVIITCPPMQMPKWDEDTLKEKGHGGSETAGIEVAKWIAKKTNRKVKIFQTRAARKAFDSGVEYLSLEDLKGYIQNVEPKAHIMWRHATKLSNAKAFVWCHDLQCPGGANVQNYDKVVALSEFHKNYLIETSGVPENKIVLGFNGINPEEFKTKYEKDPLKVVFSSSPDRGLIQTVDIVKKAREISGLDIKLHSFYGTGNMRKGGPDMLAWAERIDAHVKAHDFVVDHGMVTKQELMKHFGEAGVWLYPADFIESNCITAMEAMCSQTWPIVRAMGALPNTLKPALDLGLCDMLGVEVVDEASTAIWANVLVEAILSKKWEGMRFNPEDFSWEKVADKFIEWMEL